MPTTFYLCRHGQTENNEAGRLSGWIDTPLTEEGVRNAASSAKKLHGIKFDKIISSDMGRAFVTAYLIARKLGFTNEIERLRDLREVNYGDLANMEYAAYPELSAIQNTDYIPPNGESLAQMQKRVLACLDIISNENTGKTILIVAHDGTVNAVFASFANRDIGEVDSSSTNQHDFVAKVSYDNGKITAFDKI